MVNFLIKITKSLLIDIGIKPIVSVNKEGMIAQSFEITAHISKSISY